MQLLSSTSYATATAVLLLSPLPSFAETLDCVIEPKAIIDLAVSEKGRISDILVERGARVAKDQVLVRLEDDAQQLQLDMATVRMNSDLEIRSGETRLAQRQKDLERAKALADRNVGAVTQVEEAQIELELTKLTVEQAHLTHALAEIEHKQAQVVLDRRTVRSPADGLVMSVAIAPGAFVSEQLKIMTIAVMDPLYVEVFAPAEFHTKINVGDTFTVAQAAPLTGSYPATVNVVDQVFDAASGTFGVRLAIDNKDGIIPAGTRCQVDFNFD